MRPLLLLLPATILLLPGDGPGIHHPVLADTGRDTAGVWLDGRLALRPSLRCPMPVARGNQAAEMPNLTPPPIPPDTMPPDATPKQRLWVIPVPPPTGDQMPVARSGCWNPLDQVRRR